MNALISKLLATITPRLTGGPASISLGDLYAIVCTDLVIAENLIND